MLACGLWLKTTPLLPFAAAVLNGIMGACVDLLGHHATDVPPYTDLD